MTNIKTLRYRLMKKGSAIPESESNKPVVKVDGKWYSWRDLIYRTTPITDERRKDARERGIYPYGKFEKFSWKEAKKLLRAAEKAGLI